MTAATLHFHEALNESISSGRFEDTKIILYSRRDSSGTVCRPRALYASSNVLKVVPYFNDLLFGTFAEAESKDFSEAIDDSESAEGYGYHSDSDLEEDADIANSVDPPRPLPGDTKATHSYGEYRERSEKGKVIKIQDVAFITFQAFLLYLYTGDIKFAPYGSEENRKSRVAEIVSVSEDSIPRPSPKSIYRLADKYDVPLLKELAFASIKDGLKQCDIVEEAFSEFTSRYQEIMTVQVNHLAFAWFRGDDRSAADLGKRIDEKVDSYANGELDHAMETMVLLWELSREDGDPSPILEDTCEDYLEDWTFDHVRPNERSRDQRRFKTALIRSIREGAFFDRKYWTRHSKSARELRPLYISSIVAGERLSRINSLVKPHQEDECLDAGSGSEDSDCESDSEQASGSAPENQGSRKKGSEQEPLPVLAIGSFTSWRPLFFYLCTNVIQFAPLKSQGADMRAQYVQRETTPTKPPPCSPKTIYSLAAALDIESLRDLAFRDIKSKISSANVVTELFSGFTSRESNVMKMHCELLGKAFLEKSVTVSAVDLIKSMAGGSAAHRAGALKLALRNGHSRGGDLLHCRLLGCEFHDKPYRPTGSQLTCPRGHRQASGKTRSRAPGDRGLNTGGRCPQATQTYCYVKLPGITRNYPILR